MWDDGVGKGMSDYLIASARTVLGNSAEKVVTSQIIVATLQVVGDV